MGNKASTSEDCRAHSKHIDVQLRSQNAQHLQTKRLLLIGPKSSGKSTILLSIASSINECHHFVDTKPKAMQIQSWCYQQALDFCALNFDHLSHRKLKRLSIENPTHLPSIASIVSDIWSKRQQQNKNNLVYSDIDSEAARRVSENLDYFFANIERIMADEYEPMPRDILQCHFQHHALQTLQHEYNDWLFEWMDAPHSFSPAFSKRSYMFDNLTALLFVAPLSDYSVQTVDGQNALVQHVQSFGDCIRSKYLRNGERILLLNKEDIFQQRLKAGIPFARFRNDEYIKEMFGEDKEKLFHFVDPFEDPWYEMVVPCYIRLNTEQVVDEYKLIPLDIVRLVQRYVVRVRRPFDDDDESMRILFDEHYEGAIRLIQDAFIRQNEEPNRVVFSHVLSAVDRDTVSKVVWDCQNIVAPKNGG